MFVVTVQHRDAMWLMCYGPFQTYLAAQEFAQVKMKNHALRVLTVAVADPDE